MNYFAIFWLSIIYKTVLIQSLSSNNSLAVSTKNQNLELIVDHNECAYNPPNINSDVPLDECLATINSEQIRKALLKMFGPVKKNKEGQEVYDKKIYDKI